MQKNMVAPVLPVKSRWGSIEGKEVFLFCLRNSKGTSLLVSNFGAAAQALFFTDRYGRYADILLGYDDLAGYFTDTKLPGVGISIGLTRLFSKLKDAGLLGPPHHVNAGEPVPLRELISETSQAFAGKAQDRKLDLQIDVPTASCWRSPAARLVASARFRSGTLPPRN